MKTGKVKQVANFEKLVSMATALGAGYNPAKGSNKLPELNALLVQAHQSLQALKAAETKYINATNARVAAFNGIDKLTTRMVNAIASTEATEQMIENAMMMKQRMAGVRSFKTVAERQQSSVNPGAVTAMKDPPIAKSRGGQDFDNQAMLFEKLVDLIGSEPTYMPNEPNLQVGTLTVLSQVLRERNLAVTNAASELKIARLNRNAILFKDGIYKVAKGVKRYVKSAYGARSEQFTSIGGLEFKKQ